MSYDPGYNSAKHHAPEPSAATLYEQVLRKIMADRGTGFSEESTPEGAIVYIDTSWIAVTNEEADLLRSLHDAGA